MKTLGLRAPSHGSGPERAGLWTPSRDRTACLPGGGWRTFWPRPKIPYRDVKRLGRKIRLPERERKTVWAILEKVWQQLEAAGCTTLPAVYARLTEAVAQRKTPLYDFVVVDESQYLTVPQLRFLAALGGELPNGLFFAGDQGQRIFQQPFSWLAAGVDIRGRSRLLRINY